VIAAEGEQKASRALKAASEVIAESSAALQLRYLQVRGLQSKLGTNIEFSDFKLDISGEELYCHFPPASGSDIAHAEEG
jgi:hypothetical protein